MIHEHRVDLLHAFDDVDPPVRSNMQVYKHDNGTRIVIVNGNEKHFKIDLLMSDEMAKELEEGLKEVNRAGNK